MALRWKAFFDQEMVEREKLEDRIKGMKSAIHNDMDTIKEQHQTLVLRQGVCWMRGCVLDEMDERVRGRFLFFCRDSAAPAGAAEAG